MAFFKKADEMEIHIALKANRLAYAFLNLSLLTWILIELIVTGEPPYIPFILCSLSGVIFWSSLLFFRKQMSKDDHEE